jgi:hypothetical protein
MSIRHLACAALTVAAIASFSANAATLTHLYLLDDATDAQGGPSVLGSGAFGVNQLGATGYQFNSNQGLTFANVVNASAYSIDFSYSFDVDTGYRKLIDFKSLASDAGLYNLSQRLNFYPVTSGSPQLVAGQLARVTLTRDTAGQVMGYVNGVQEISFSDTGNLATFSDPQQLARMFQDDNTTGGRESSGGFVDYVRIYDGALSAGEVASLTNPVAAPVPEPSSWALMAIGLLAVTRLAPCRRQQ